MNESVLHRVTAPGRAGRFDLARVTRRRLLTGLVAVGGAVALAACGAAVTGVADVSGDAAATGARSFPRGDVRPAEDFTFMAYASGDQLGGSELRFSEILAQGKPVVLNFWAGLCPPCRVEMPDLQAVHEAIAGRVNVIGLDVGPFVNLGTREQGRKLADELNITYPTGTTSDAQIIQKYRVLGMPTTVFITPRGEIVRQWTGILNEASLLDLIGELEEASKA